MVKRSWVRGGIALYFPHQVLQIDGFSQYSNYPGQIEFGESEYRFPTGTVTRKVNPIPARYQAWDRHAELWYRWYNEKSLLSLYANIGPFDRYHDDWAGEVIHTQPGVPADTLRYHHSHNLKSFLPDFGGYFHTKVGEAGEIFASAEAGYGNEQRREGQLEERLHNGLATKVYEVESQIKSTNLETKGIVGYSGDYEINDGLGFSLDARLSHQYIRLRASRNGAAEALDQHNRGRATARFMLNWGRTIQLYLYGDALAYTEAKQRWNYRLLPTLGMNLRPTKWWRLQGSFRLEGSPASIGQLNPYGYAASRYIWQQGNPSLVAPWGQRYLLSNQFSWNPLRFTLQAQYGRYRNEIALLDRLAQDAHGDYYILRQYENLPLSQYFRLYMGMRLSLWDDQLLIQLAPRITYYTGQLSDGKPYGYWMPGIVAREVLSWNDWALDLMQFYGGSDGIQGEIWQHTGFSCTAELSYKYGNFRFAVGAQELFVNPHTQWEKNLSPVLRSTTYTYSKQEANHLYIDIQWLLEWGHQADVPSEQVDFGGVESLVR